MSGPSIPSLPCPVPIPAQIDPFVSNGLQNALGSDWLDYLNDAVASANKQQIQELIEWKISDGTDFALFASGMLKWVPTENAGGKVIYDVLCVFYFVFDQASINKCQTPIDTDSIRSDGSVIFTPLSQWMVYFAQQMGAFMGTTASLTADSYESFVQSPLYHLEEADTSKGFRTFNELFARRLIQGMRPISCPTDDRIITYPADSTFNGAWPISPGGTVDINTYKMQTASCKGIDWPISALLEGSRHAGDFDNGIWMHAFLSPTDYHRQHAPVSGTVLEAKNIMGLAYFNIVTETIDGKKHPRTHRNFKKKTFYVKNEGPDVELDAPDDPGYQFLQLRASIIIHNDVVGNVAVLPIGMAQVSSVLLNPAIVPVEGQPLPTVQKGDEISHFEFGGSDIVLVFQETAKVLILGNLATLPDGTKKGQKYLVGEPLGIAGIGT